MDICRSTPFSIIKFFSTDDKVQILEGIATVAIGIASFWVVVDFPDSATFLSHDDRRRVIRRLQEDQQASAGHEDLKMSYIRDSLTDWKTYTGCLIYMGVAGTPYPSSRSGIWG